MKIRMRTTAASSEDTMIAGKIYEVEAKTAKSFIDGGYAEAVEVAKPAKAAKTDSKTPAPDGAGGADDTGKTAGTGGGTGE